MVTESMSDKHHTRRLCGRVDPEAYCLLKEKNNKCVKFWISADEWMEADDAKKGSRSSLNG